MLVPATNHLFSLRYAPHLNLFSVASPYQLTWCQPASNLVLQIDEPLPKIVEGEVKLRLIGGPGGRKPIGPGRGAEEGTIALYEGGGILK